MSAEDGNRKRRADVDGEECIDQGVLDGDQDRSDSPEDYGMCSGGAESWGEDGRRCSDSGDYITNKIRSTRSLSRFSKHSNGFVVSPPPVRSLFTMPIVDDDTEDASLFSIAQLVYLRDFGPKRFKGFNFSNCIDETIFYLFPTRNKQNIPIPISFKKSVSKIREFRVMGTKSQVSLLEKCPSYGTINKQEKREVSFKCYKHSYFFLLMFYFYF